MGECFRCKKQEPETRCHRLHLSCNAWNKVLLVCSDCIGWFQNILNAAEKHGYDGP
jgi:hypothetical protein